jgi:hypothetical protein
MKQGRCPVSGISNPASQRPSVIGYGVGAIVATLIYVSWFVFVLMKPDSETPEGGFGARFLIASFFWLGFAVVLLLMIVPWTVAVSTYRKARWSGRIYFPAVGAFLVFVFGCTLASLAPKPLFIEDQTFLQGAMIAAERQGIVILVAGLAFGASYWFFGERRIPARDKQDIA